MSGKIIIWILIFVFWVFFRVYKNAAEEENKTKRKREKAPKKRPDIFKELERKFEEFAEEMNPQPKPVKQPRRERPVVVSTEKNTSSEKKDWEFGVDEMKTAAEAHVRHGHHIPTKFEVSQIEKESSEGAIIAEEFDLKKAVIYGEILNRPYED